jgi:hypothetical protein
MIPSFFRTLQYLNLAKRDYAIVFRTFGKDLENVVWEFNKYCSGEHICYNGKNGTPKIKSDGQQGSKDYRITSKQLGLNYRSGRALQNTHLITGTLTRVTILSDS